MSDQKAATHGLQQTKKATASGWIGSVLEYYDFFIYATVASLIFPQIFFPSGNPTVAIVASLATYGVGYVARPIGAFFLGHWGDTHGRKQVMVRLVQGFAVAGEISGASSMILEHAPLGRRGYYGSFTLQGVQAGQILAAAIFLPLAYYLPSEQFNSWGWRVPFLLSFIVIIVGYYIRREVEETPVFAAEAKQGAVPRAPIVQAFAESGPNMLRVVCMALMNVIPVVTTVFGAAYAVQPGYGIGFDKSVYLWIPVLGNIVAVLVIPFVGNLSDRIGRRPPIIVGAIGAGLLSFGYLYAISTKNVPLAVVMSLLMWGVVYQGYNAVFPSFYPELFPARTRVTAMAISQNIGTMFTALLPALFAAVAPPGVADIATTVGAIALGITVIASLAAWSARETFRLQTKDLGKADAVPVPAAEYDKARAQALASAKR